jgi:hypothetical protein
MRCKLGTASLILVCTTLRSVGALGTAAEELTAKRDPLLLRAVHTEFATPPSDWKSRSGAAGLNAEKEHETPPTWFIEYQMQGGKFVIAGLAADNKEAIDWGLKVIEWGFARMQPDGSFDHPDNYHSASFFIESTAHALLLLEASPLRDRYAERVAKIKPQLHKAAQWKVRPDIHDWNWPEPGTPVDNTRERKYTHRYYLVASAVGLTGVLCQDDDLKEKSRYYIDAGIARQQPDGVNPERDGHDTSYQAVGLMYAGRCYRLVADEQTKKRMRPMLEKGTAWLLGRVQPDGSINLEGNVRTGPGQEPSRRGKPKTHDYPATVQALSEWSALSGDCAARKAAEKVAAFSGQQAAR